MSTEKKIVLTAQGYLELETELNELKTVVRPRVIKDLKDARAQGDLSENAEYDAARDEQAQVEARIKELEYKLDSTVFSVLPLFIGDFLYKIFCLKEFSFLCFIIYIFIL